MPTTIDQDRAVVPIKLRRRTTACSGEPAMAALIRAKRARATSPTRFLHPLTLLGAALRRWLSVRAGVRAVAELDDRELRDIGLSRYDILAAVRGVQDETLRDDVRARVTAPFPH